METDGLETLSGRSISNVEKANLKALIKRRDTLLLRRARLRNLQTH